MTTNPGSLADISFRLLQPKLMDPPLIISEPERALEDIPFDEVIMLMTWLPSNCFAICAR